MASTNKKKAFISLKLTFLKDQRDHFMDAVSVYIDGIIEAGKLWTEGGDNQMNYLELGQMIDSAVVFLSEKSDELPDETQLTQILARVSVTEEALCSFRSNAEKIAEQQRDMEQQLKELLSKLSESDKKANSKFRKVKEQISEINDTQVALEQEQEARLESLEKQLQKLSTTQDRMKEEIESKTEVTEKQLHKLSMAQDRLKAEMEYQAILTEKQLQKLSTAQDRIKEEMESQTELTEKLVHVPDQLESVKEKLDVFDARIGRIMDDCSNKHQDIEHVTRDLADKVMANTETVQVISADQDKKTTLLREMETRIQTLEADSGRNVEDVQKQVEKGKANFQILCQMLNDRLTPLEQLRNCLNERSSTRDENIKQLTQVIQKVTAMSRRLQQLERKCSRPRCGFTAWTCLNNVARNPIRPYHCQDSNVGGNFDANCGIFTAPVDGLYVASVSLHLKEKEKVDVHVYYEKHNSPPSTFVCSCTATVADTQACSVGVVSMKAGDTLFSSMYRGNTTELGQFVSFCCFLLA